MMYLDRTPIPSIMMQGCWDSNAFLRYIEKQVLQFSQGISQGMIKHNTFYNVPVQTWTTTDANTHSRSANHYLPQLLHQIPRVFGPYAKLDRSYPHCKIAPESNSGIFTTPSSIYHSNSQHHTWFMAWNFCDVY